MASPKSGEKQITVGQCKGKTKGFWRGLSEAI
jgi:hypothetical protein